MLTHRFSGFAHTSPSRRKTVGFAAGNLIRHLQPKQQPEQRPSSRHPDRQMDGSDLSRISVKIEKRNSRN